LIVLAAFFTAAVAAFVRIEVLALLLATLLVALASRLLSFLRITSRRLMGTALLTGASAYVTLFHSLIAFTIVCHICSSPLVVD
jgi:hypothetical protein